MIRDVLQRDQPYLVCRDEYLDGLSCDRVFYFAFSHYIMKIFVTCMIPQDGLRLLKEMFEVEIFEYSNIVVLPHIGSASIETRTKMSLMVANN